MKKRKKEKKKWQQTENENNNKLTTTTTSKTSIHRVGFGCVCRDINLYHFRRKYINGQPRLCINNCGVSIAQKKESKTKTTRKRK